jgi:hypothetical protein
MAAAVPPGNARLLVATEPYGMNEITLGTAETQIRTQRSGAADKRQNTNEKNEKDN